MQRKSLSAMPDCVLSEYRRKPQKPFSRCAAKRRSAIALDSNEHLQELFYKGGVCCSAEVSLSNFPVRAFNHILTFASPLKPSNNAQPALGPGILKIGTDLPALATDIILPPTPVLPY